MTLSTFLQQIATESGPERLKGAVVLAALDRPIDDLIRQAQGLGPYHRGKPSPWSHTFLIADVYSGPATPILDCTIRDSQGRVAWDEKLDEVLKTGIARSGGIYTGRIDDYDDPRVTAVGVKCIFDLSAEDRDAIVAAGRALQAEGYHYDIPGLLRELVRLLMGIEIPPGEKLLFCSGFCQAAYRNALGARGDFAPEIATADTTPDDIWFSPLGNGVKP
ncbi:MAG: hypothetical protein EDX89_22635 [Acidobacteria bacterium]|nr:MAG: hypothetical protein EDX89_22635 [Acidobacteriota bacterium]